MQRYNSNNKAFSPCPQAVHVCTWIIGQLKRWGRVVENMLSQFRRGDQASQRLYLVRRMYSIVQEHSSQAHNHVCLWWILRIKISFWLSEIHGQPLHLPYLFTLTKQRWSTMDLWSFLVQTGARSYFKSAISISLLFYGETFFVL